MTTTSLRMAPLLSAALLLPLTLAMDGEDPVAQSAPITPCITPTMGGLCRSSTDCCPNQACTRFGRATYGTCTSACGPCPPGSSCRVTEEVNCCVPVTCARKCPAGQQCQRLRRQCKHPNPNSPPAPCYCLPLFGCVPISTVVKM